MIDKILKINFCIISILFAAMIVLLFVLINTDSIKYTTLFFNVGLSAMVLAFISMILAYINPDRYK